MQNGLAKTLFFLLLCQGASAAETVYVHDQLRLGVRPSPDPAASSISVVTTGDALTVLGEQDDFLNIRTEKGLEGWVSRGYVSKELPARNQLQTLKEEYKALQQARDALQKKLDTGGEQDEQQVQQQQRLERENAALQQQLNSYNAETAATVTPPSVPEATATHASSYKQYRWQMLLALLAILVTSFFTGMIIGVRKKSRQVADRIGGLEI